MHYTDKDGLSALIRYSLDCGNFGDHHLFLDINGLNKLFLSLSYIYIYIKFFNMWID